MGAPRPDRTGESSSKSAHRCSAFGLDPNGHRQRTPGPVTYCHVDDLKDLLGRHGGGKLVVTLTDPDGNVFGLSQEP
jgi:hypothetical protein